MNILIFLGRKKVVVESSDEDIFRVSPCLKFRIQLLKFRLTSSIS